MSDPIKVEFKIVDRPIFFEHGGVEREQEKGGLKSYSTPGEVAEWEKMMLEGAGIKADGNAIIAGGGSCSGTGGGQCDVD